MLDLLRQRRRHDRLSLQDYQRACGFLGALEAVGTLIAAAFCVYDVLDTDRL